MDFRAVRLHLTLLLVALYLLLEAAFMLIRLPPGTVSAIPTGELLILFFFVTLAADLHLIRPFLLVLPAAPFVIWWVIGGTQLAIAVPQHGFWALRDATSLIESLFLWIGFVVAAVPGAMTTIIRWFHGVLMLAVLVALTYPFREALAAISPVILSAQMREFPLFFTYQLTPMTAMTGAVRILVTNRQYLGLRAEWIAAALLVFVAVFWQARTIYLQIAFIFLLFAVTRPGNVFKLLTPLAAAVVLFAALVALGVPVPGRLSGNVSFSFYFEHFLAIGGSGAHGSDDAAIQSAAGGVGQRLQWWQAIWDNVTATWSSTLFGLGYGVSLVGLANDHTIDSATREPHNSLISAMARVGFIGLAAYVWMHLALTLTLIRTYLSYKAQGERAIAQFLYLAGVLFGLLWISAMGEDSFEKPFVSIPYYFCYGVILNLWYRDAFARAQSVPSNIQPH